MLELHDVCRSFGGTQVLHDISFNAARGRLTGFVGGNGAGKTTTMRILMGVLASDSGIMRLDRQELGSQSRSRFGYMPSERGLYPKMKIAEQITYLARLHGYSKQEATQRAENLLTQLGLGERLKDPLEALSLGNQQRVQIAASLVHDPDVLILDEPFSGLDPFAVDQVRQVLTERAESGAVVLFSSHQLDVVEQLCDDLVIIGNGRILAAGAREDLRRSHGTLRYELAAPGDLSWAQTIAGVTPDEAAEGRILFRAEPQIAQQVLTEAIKRGPVERFTDVLPTLSEIFRDYTQDTTSSTEQEAAR